MGLLASGVPTGCSSGLMSATVGSMKAELDGTNTTTCGQSMAASTGEVVGTMPYTICCMD